MASPPSISAKAEALVARLGLSYEHLLGIRFAVNVFIATTIVWSVLKLLDDTNPIWAIASMVAAAEPEPEEARRLFRSRLINVLVGCGVGFCFVLLGGGSNWMLPFALAVTVLLSSYVVRIKTMWRQAPITAAVVIAAGISQSSTLLINAAIRSPEPPCAPNHATKAIRDKASDKRTIRRVHQEDADSEAPVSD